MITIYFVNPDNYSDFVSGHLEENQIKEKGFFGKHGQVICLLNNKGCISKVLVGLKIKSDPFWTVASLTHQLPEGLYQFDATFLDKKTLLLFHLAWYLGLYRFDRYKTQIPKKVLLEDHVDLDSNLLHRMVQSINWVRDMINTPAEDCGPKDLELNIKQLAKTFDAQMEVFKGEELIEKGYPLVHAVGRASDRKPRVVNLTWGDESHKSLVLIGKGVCFDTGGLDLKSAVGMRQMKKDMAGAANVIGLANLIMGLQLPIYLKLMIPIVDNNLSANSYRPGDIFTSRNGKTVEIGNTDAEGRLILADVLSAACESDPDLIIDFATLTGNRALGSVVSCFSHDVEMTQELQMVGKTYHDPVWSMPLIKQYSQLFESDIADLVNIPKLVVDCGTATAAMFLNEFVSPKTSWIHCDILGFNPNSLPGRPKGGEAMGLRAFYHFLDIWSRRQ